MRLEDWQGTAEVGVAHGRFQPLHPGHLEYLLAAKARCRLLVVGITNPDPSQTAHEQTDPGRGLPDANPFTYYERHVMVERSLVDAGVGRDEFRIVPFPHSFPDRLRHYAPRDATYFLTVYDAWGDAKNERLRALGLRVEILWRREHKVTTGTEIRSLMRSGRPWEHLVDRAVARTVRELPETRIRELAGETGR